MAKSGRVFLRGMASETYGLKEFRAAQLEFGARAQGAAVQTTGVQTTGARTTGVTA